MRWARHSGRSVLQMLADFSSMLATIWQVNYCETCCEIFKRPIVPQDVPARVASEAQLPHAPGEPEIRETRVEAPQA